MSTRPETPECQKMLAVADHSQKIGEFLDWLGEQGIHLASYINYTDRGNEVLTPISGGFERLLARYFVIDPDKVDQEKRALLEWLRDQHDVKESAQ